MNIKLSAIWYHNNSSKKNFKRLWPFILTSSERIFKWMVIIGMYKGLFHWLSVKDFLSQIYFSSPSMWRSILQRARLGAVTRVMQWLHGPLCVTLISPVWQDNLSLARGAITHYSRPPGCLCYLFPVSLPGVDVAQHGVSQHVVTGHPQQVALLTLHQVVVRATYMAHMAELSVLFLSRVEMIH